ncbi:ELAV-like protein 1-A [Condylostylus longicornis]|uniref:ELAV-like protein 1-A n=1 Tax=Condylostylus longicornis TaxID=2530218 RepID=UPI00244DEC8D|nr:ELAV-like protein 1-A [Condylostylus longicornis]
MVGGPVHVQSKREARYNPMKKQVQTEYRHPRDNEASTANDAAANPISILVREYSIYIFNLADDVIENDLWRLFGPFGAIKNVAIMRDPKTHQSKGFGFVTMKNLSEAENAIDILNGHAIRNRPMKVSFKGARTKYEDEENPMGEPGAYQIYVFNLSPNTIEDELWKLFAQFGAVKSVSIVVDQKTQKSKGFAFITMKILEEAQKAIQTLNGFKLNGRNLMVSFKGQRPDDHEFNKMNPDVIQSVPIYINYLPHDIDDGTVWKLFSQFGAIKDVNIVRDSETRKCLGYAFVNMKNLEDATIAISSLNGFELNGKRLHVSLKTKRVKE